MAVPSNGDHTTTPTPAAYPLAGGNDPIGLYTGAMTLRSSEGEAATAAGLLTFSWLPRPRLSFELDAAPQHWHRPPPTYYLSLDELPAAPSAEALVSWMSVGTAGSSARGHLRPVTIGDDTHAFDRMRFFVPNWRSMIGSWLDTPEGGGWMGRLSWAGHDWRVCLDARSDVAAVTDELQVVGGYGITHVGEITRRDGRAFSLQEGRESLRCLRYFLGFARGLWTPPTLPVGVRGGDIVWREWASVTADPWRATLTWVDDADSLALAFAAFAGRWADIRWRESLELAVSWFVEANPSDPAETSIVLAQVALELLGWLILVEDEGVITRADWEKGRDKAERHLRSLLTHMRVPTAIPFEKKELFAVASKERWSDGPRALTGFRNKLVHPRDRASQIFGTPLMARVELAELATWYCELALLYFCGYEAKYWNRNSGAAEPVPWI